MNRIFNNIHTDDSGICIPLPPLAEAMTYQYEKKQTDVIDSSKVLSFDQQNAELFYPKMIVNIETTGLLKRTACEIANFFPHEVCDLKKATSNYSTSADGKFIWGYTAGEEHFCCQGMITNNDLAGSPFASLTCQLQSLLGMHILRLLGIQG